MRCYFERSEMRGLRNGISHISYFSFKRDFHTRSRDGMPHELTGALTYFDKEGEDFETSGTSWTP